MAEPAEPLTVKVDAQESVKREKRGRLVSIRTFRRPYLDDPPKVRLVERLTEAFYGRLEKWNAYWGVRHKE